MKRLKNIFIFLGVFALLSAPAFFFYKAPKDRVARMELVQPHRGIASTMKPATRTCEMIQRVRWACVTLRNGQRKCHRDGFENVRHCKPL